ncbi:MAG: rod shape-determining protein MreC [Solirubrobacteraceae bacterium]
MHDKTIRRRRAVLALLVVISLILLTDYFGESASSPLHSLQRGVVAALAPLESGASTVLSPVRDVAGWFSATFKAKSEVAQYQRQNQALKQQIAKGQYDEVQYRRDQALLKLDSGGLRSDGPVTANVSAFDPSLWYDTINIDRGSDAGIAVGNPVVGPGGLVGEVSETGASYAVISLLTSPRFAVTAMIENQKQDVGIIKPETGSPGTLVLGQLSTSAQVSAGQEVVTSGFVDPHLAGVRSLFPPGILIGQISNTNPQNSLLTGQSVYVTPAADLLHLSVVQVLTKPHG